MPKCDTWTAEGEPFVLISLRRAAAASQPCAARFSRCLAVPPACACDLGLSSFESSAGDMHFQRNPGVANMQAVCMV